jgi:hypothetical protein
MGAIIERLWCDGWFGLRCVGFVGLRRSGYGVLGLGLGNGFVWRNVFGEMGAELAEAFEFFDGSAIVALSLGLIAEEEGPGVEVLAGHGVEAGGEEVVAVLGADFHGVDVEQFVEGNEGDFVVHVEHGSVEGGGEEAGFEARHADEVVLGEGDAFDGEEFLGVGGGVGGDGIGAEVVDGVAVFDFDDGEVGAGEGVLAGILRCSGLAGGGAGACGLGGVGAVGGELFFSGWLLTRHAME